MAGEALLLLPPRARFGAQRFAHDTARRLGRGDRSTVQGVQHTRLFDVLPRGWPVAAVTRAMDAPGDAGNARWLRADPAHVRVEANGARLLATGQALSVAQGDVDALLPALRPLFGDAGLLLDAPVPHRWYLRMPVESRLPDFAAPDDAVGADLFDCLPGRGSDDPLGRRWRALLSEVQVVLHQHPRNAARQAAGLPSINSLWFWGAGVAPDHVTGTVARLATPDDAWRAFAQAAGMGSTALPAAWTPGGGDGAQAFDLRHLRDLALLQRDWLTPLLQALDARTLQRVRLDFEDGLQLAITRGQRWRVWRRLWSQPGLDTGLTDA